jgi:hypothetical protein
MAQNESAVLGELRGSVNGYEGEWISSDFQVSDGSRRSNPNVGHLTDSIWFIGLAPTKLSLKLFVSAEGIQKKSGEFC